MAVRLHASQPNAIAQACCRRALSDVTQALLGRCIVVIMPGADLHLEHAWPPKRVAQVFERDGHSSTRLRFSFRLDALPHRNGPRRHIGKRRGRTRLRTVFIFFLRPRRRVGVRHRLLAVVRQGCMAHPANIWRQRGQMYVVVQVKLLLVHGFQQAPRRILPQLSVVAHLVWVGHRMRSRRDGWRRGSRLDQMRAVGGRLHRKWQRVVSSRVWSLRHRDTKVVTAGAGHDGDGGGWLRFLLSIAIRHSLHTSMMKPPSG